MKIILAALIAIASLTISACGGAEFVKVDFDKPNPARHILERP